MPTLLSALCDRVYQKSGTLQFLQEMLRIVGAFLFSFNMANINRIKRLVRGITGLGEVFAHRFTTSKSGEHSCILYYHRVADIDLRDPAIDDRNVPPSLFEEHLKALRDFAEIVPVAELIERRGMRRSPSGKPLVSLTFDDGYANFRSNVLPLLERYQVPAALNIVTGYVDTIEPAPFDRWARKNLGKVPVDSWRMVTWGELEECVASGLVTLGGHSHTHIKASECTPARLNDETARSAESLRCRFGPEHAQIYAYPFGNSVLGHISEAYEAAIRSAGFTIGLATDVGMVSAESEILRLPRIEAHDQDTPATIRAKSAGAIAPLYLNRWFHRVVAWSGRRAINSIPAARTTDLWETGSSSVKRMQTKKGIGTG